MPDLYLISGIFSIGVGLFGLLLLLWRQSQSYKDSGVNRISGIGYSSLSLSLIALGANSLAHYAMVGGIGLKNILSFIAFICCMIAISSILQDLRTRKKSK